MCKVHVIEKLSAVFLVHKVHRLQFKYYLVIDNKVHAVSLVKLHIVPKYG